jgi:predicted nucleic acid-binding protein
MIVIVDSNKVISAVYTPKGAEASIFSAKSRIQFIAPDYIIEEINDHIDEIAEAISRPKKDTRKLFSDILANIKIIEVAKIPKKDIAEALAITKDIDPKDIPFVSLYFFTKHKLWTGDRKLISGLKNKGYDVCITTTELRKSLYKK